MSNNVQVKDALLANVTLKTTESGGVHTPHHNVENLSIANASDPTITEGGLNTPLSLDLTGYLRTKAKQSGTWSVGITGNLPAFAATPTVNLGTLNGAATAAKQPALGVSGTPSTDVLTIQGVAGMTAIKVDGTATTQPISAASLPLPTGAATAAKQPALGTAGSAASDVITVQGIASMTAIKVDGSATTQPVSLASQPLPTGASTSAKQPALGTAGTASTDVLTIQGIAGMTAIKVDGSGVTQPISATSLPLPTGAATSAKQPALGTAGSASTDVLTIQGIASMVALKVDGSAVTQPISMAAALPAGTNAIGKVTPQTSGSDVAAGNPLPVTIISGASAGTQYTEDAAAAADPVGTMMMGVRRDTLSTSEVSADGDNIAIKASNKGQIHVKEADSEILLGALTETAPASDTASSGINGRLQRIAQNLTTMINDTTAADVNLTKVNGTTLSNSNPVPTKLTPSTPYFNSACGTTKYLVGSAGNNVVASYYIENPDASAKCYVQFFDAATTGAVTLGTTTPVWSIGLDAKEKANLSGLHLNFASGIVIAGTSTATGSSAPTTAPVVNIGYRAA